MWATKLDLTDLWQNSQEFNLKQIIEKTIERLKKLDDEIWTNKIKKERQRIVFEFEKLAQICDDWPDNYITNEYSRILQTLYDWGDQMVGDGKRVCWIATTF